MLLTLKFPIHLGLIAGRHRRGLSDVVIRDRRHLDLLAGRGVREHELAYRTNRPHGLAGIGEVDSVDRLAKPLKLDPGDRPSRAGPGRQIAGEPSQVPGEFGRARGDITNVPTENPRTGNRTAMSVGRAIADALDPVRIGNCPRP